MQHAPEAVFLSLVAGSAIGLGALFAFAEQRAPRQVDAEFPVFMTALGGGALLAAVALVLIPEGLETLPIYASSLSFVAGGGTALAIDRYFAARKGAAAQLSAMLLDFIPETIVIGAVIAADIGKAVFMTLIIFLQNVPESFAAYRELSRQDEVRPSVLLLVFGAATVSGPVFVFIGAGLFLGHPGRLGALMTYCSGGIIYFLFNDIAPKATLKNHWWPPFGALIGFLIGMIGDALT
ncbi:MAG: divalent cation transporter [Alphaproteobacteria bacterium]|nr:divalent cation transporter [Alphaproteobacteria bacterium]